MGQNNLNNRELSWLNFNERVMQEASDESVPLMQRLRFLGIYSNNQDEFFKVRVSSVVSEAKDKSKKMKDEAVKLLEAINFRTKELQNQFEDVLDKVFAEMASKGVLIVNEMGLSEEQKEFAYSYFVNNIRSRLVPLVISKKQPMPFLQDDKIYLGIRIYNKDGDCNYFIIEIPNNIPRFIVMPTDDKASTFIMFVDDVIRLALSRIFFMFQYKEIGAYTFKITRDAEMDLDADVSKSLVEKMTDSLHKRTFGKPVRIVYDESMPKDLKKLLIDKLGLKNTDNIVYGGRYHQMRDLMKFPVVRQDLEDVSLHPISPKYVSPYSSILNTLKGRDILLNYPYHSFGFAIDFLREAAFDPKVKDIYVTLYRVANNSHIINALVSAAKNGKNVVAFVELQARFDEEHNIECADILQDAGVRVLPSMQDFKVHCKLIMVRHRDKNKVTNFTYIGTGNLNESTAKLYTDFGLFTSNKTIAEDAAKIFYFLEFNHKRFECSLLEVAPYTMRSFLEKSINREIKHANEGREAFIYMKINGLVDEKIIKLLYKASQSGVQIKLLVRGICCLKPGIVGLSENIEARSIVDKYLEHSRVFIFCNSGEHRTYISSADIMGRNLDRRIEVTAPILDKNVAKTLLDVFEIQWSDNVKSRNIATNIVPVIDDPNVPLIRSQIALYDYYTL